MIARYRLEFAAIYGVLLTLSEEVPSPNHAAPQFNENIFLYSHHPFQALGQTIVDLQHPNLLNIRDIIRISSLRAGTKCEPGFVFVSHRILYGGIVYAIRCINCSLFFYSKEPVDSDILAAAIMLISNCQTQSG